MAYNSNILVSVPKEKIAYKDPNKDGSKYVYYLTECYRDKKGKPTNRRKLIGKIAQPSHIGYKFLGLR